MAKPDKTNIYLLKVLEIILTCSMLLARSSALPGPKKAKNSTARSAITQAYSKIYDFNFFWNQFNV